MNISADRLTMAATGSSRNTLPLHQGVADTRKLEKERRR